MADFIPDDTTLRDQRTQEENPRPLLGMATIARVTRTFRFDDQSQVESVLEETRTHAEAVGWSLNEDPTTPGFRASKDLEPGPGRLAVGVGPEGGVEGAHLVLVIRLDFSSVGTVDSNDDEAVDGG
jgi:hypothetical protein